MVEAEPPPEFVDVLEAATVLDDLGDLARAQAWASSVLAVWAEAPDAAEIDRELVEWLDASDDPRAGPLLELVTELLPASPASPHPSGRRARACTAWKVTDADVVSIGLGFELADGSSHSLLGDVVAGELTSLVVAPGATEILAAADESVAFVPMDISDAACVLVDAWRELAAGDNATPESVIVNGALAARRLEEVTGQDLWPLVRPARQGPDATGGGSQPAPSDTVDPETVELNAWALSVLDGAGAGPGSPAPAELLDALVPARIAEQPAREQEAYGALEWADWLGVALGLWRSEPGIAVDAEHLVDLVNRCPEVTSSIPARDRPYFAWAFSLVLPLWRAAGVLDAAGRLTADGADRLIGALREAWEPS